MDINNKPDHIEDYLASLHTGQWFGWSDSKNKIYSNLIIHAKLEMRMIILLIILILNQLKKNALMG